MLEWSEVDGRRDPAQRFALYCLRDGEKELLATAATPEALGVALVTLGREGELEECPIGILDRMGEVGQKWIVRPWLPSPRNASDAGRLLRSRRKDSGR